MARPPVKMSSRESRILAEIQGGLLQDDPRLAARLTTQRLPRSRFAHAAAWFVVGSIVLVGGTALVQLFVVPGMCLAATGFLLMVRTAWAMSRTEPSLPSSQPGSDR